MRIGSQEWYDLHPNAPTRAEAEADLAASRREQAKRERDPNYRPSFDWRNRFTPEQIAQIEAEKPF